MSQQEQAEEVKARLAEWLAPRGLAFNEDKTRIVNLDDGCDFLGFSVRRQSGKLLIKPSKAAVKRIRQRLRTEMRSLRGANVAMVLQRLTPIVRGWATYYRSVVSSEVFNALDTYLWRLTYKWAKFRHPKKPKHWIVERYFGRFNKSRRDRWVFGDRQSGAYLVKFAWTNIVRHQMVTKGASPDDPALTEYWSARRRRAAPPPLDNLSLRLLRGRGAPASVRGPAPRCRPSAAEPTRVGAVGACHRQGIGQAPHDLPKRRFVGRWHHPSHPYPLPPTDIVRDDSGTSTSATPHALGLA